MRPHRLFLVGLLVIFSFRVVNDIVRPIFFKRIVDLLSLGTFDRAAVADKVLIAVAILIGLNLISAVLGRSSSFMHVVFEIRVIKRLRTMIFKKIESHSQTFFANTFAGSLVTKSRRFVGAFESMFDIFIFSFWNIAIVILSSLAVLATQAPLIAGIFVVWIAVYILVVSSLVRKKMRYDMEEAQADSKIGGYLADVFGNNLAVKTFSAGRREASTFGKIVEVATEKAKRAWYFGSKISTVQAVIVFSAQSIVLYVMIRLWIRNAISTGTVVLIQTYMVILFDRMWDLGNALTRFMKSAADMQEMVDIIEAPRDIVDPVEPQPSRMHEGHIQFNSVSFSYPNSKGIFENLNLDIKPGERVGLVGHSGAGKSTITKLLLRFTDVTAGAITIDGQDIRHVTQDDLRSAVSYVPQEPVLFHRSLRENIAYGKPDATLEEVIEASRRAHAHEFIERLEEGYETEVGERGVKLSGGERQRVAIARAILKDSPVLVLDEATSALDSHSEALIQEAFDELMRGKTTIVIAHRLSTIQKMDRIIVLEDGYVAEEGTHTELLAKDSGIYKQMWDLQAGGFIDDEV